MTSTKRRIAAGMGALLVAAALGGATPAVADPDNGPSNTPPPKVDLVLDLSGSMNQNDAGGETRISAAKKAFNEILDSLPNDALVGLRVLGQGNPGDNKTAGCRETAQLAPVGAPNKVAMKAAVAAQTPTTGWTPIALALQEAANDLGNEQGSRRIILITDGEDSCAPPNPCDVARQLAAQGLNLVIDTLGLVPDEKTRRQLTCIAEATGGTYTSANTAQELSQRVTQLVDRAVVKAEEVTIPTTVKGSPNGCADAPLLGPGVYADRIVFEQHLWYKVPQLPGQELRASATVGIDRAVARDYDATITAVTEDGRDLARYTDAGSGRVDGQSAGLRYSLPKKGDDDPQPKDAKTTCLMVSTAFNANASVPREPGMPLELLVDLVKASDAQASDTHGLGRGWIFIGVLAGVGLVGGLLFGWLVRLIAGMRRAV
ncbi:VWA domain-containing protein [Yinghuangia sp. ASG 101]|uniref:VWA domain-containing protein n=1 Tax=Yinghuangia sp. ASG 101 TaxID=2896848 RepID=UPI001E2E13B9|nr:VWA domain-containing protein [Yinghuangia sp. ASG 101]UGQ10873.1 VWA domain-containing protein [Yinghuangia sp. ASG 101]